MLHPMLGGILSLGIVILGKVRGSRVSSRRLALLVLFVSIENFRVTGASSCALVKMCITDSFSGIFWILIHELLNQKLFWLIN